MIYFIKEKKLVKAKVKIGRTDRSVQTRLKELQTSSPIDLQIVGTIADNNHYGLTEKGLQQTFSKYKVNREWFKFSDEIKKFIKFINGDGFFMSARPLEFSLRKYTEKEGVILGHGRYEMPKDNIRKGDRYLSIVTAWARKGYDFPNLSQTKQYVDDTLYEYEYKLHGHKNGPIVVEITKVP